MITLRCQQEDEVRAVLAALEDGRLAAAVGPCLVSVWLDDTYRGGSPGTEAGPEHARARGRHARVAQPPPKPRRTRRRTAAVAAA